MPLPPLLIDGLDVVFVGTEPGKKSLHIGCYYADPSNRFYRHLYETNFTPRRLAPVQFRELLSHKVGLDDVYEDPAGLRHRLLKAAPRAVCFNSRQALARFAGLREDEVKPPWRREDARRYADLDVEILWATGDSSFKGSSHWPKRIDDLQALRERLHGAT
jgi:hypothetical protein